MSLINALSISIGVLSVVATYLALGPFSSFLQVWALFIGWGCYYQAGASTDTIQKCAPAHIWGAIVAAIALFLVGAIGGSLIVTSIIVGLSVFALVIGANVPALGAIPAAVYGYASTAGFVLVSGASLSLGSTIKSAIVIVISLAVGHVFGLLSQKGAGMLTKSE